MAAALTLFAYLDPGDPEKGGLSTIAIVGIVVGGGLVLSALGVMIYRRGKSSGRAGEG